MFASSIELISDSYKSELLHRTPMGIVAHKMLYAACRRAYIAGNIVIAMNSEIVSIYNLKIRARLTFPLSWINVNKQTVSFKSSY